MAEPTLLGDVLQPAWQALTPEQRSCWHFWAATHPVITAQGNLTTLYGQQAHYQTNASLALPDDPTLITNPPTTPATVKTYVVISIDWPITALLEGTITTRGGFAFVSLEDPAPSDQIAIVTQTYTQKKSGKGRPPRTRHVRVIIPATTGTINLQAPDGYFATTAGNNKFARIKGKTARRRPDLPLGKLRIVSTIDGSSIRQILANPNGGARTGINRPRATAVKPTPGDHFP